VGLGEWTKGMAQMEPVMDCSKAQTLLSDLLDVHRGERPAPMESPLGHAPTLQALESHVEGCAACQQELRELEELGLAFSDFCLDEPGEAHFAGYGRMVNERISRMTRRTTARSQALPVSAWRTWVSTVAASAAAAVFTVVLLGPRGQATPSTVEQAQVPLQADALPKRESEGVHKSISEKEINEQLAEVDRIDVPTLEPRAQTLSLMTAGEGSRLVTYDPAVDKKSPTVWLPEKKTCYLGDSPSALMGIMFKATGEEDPAGGLCVVAVKRGGPADAIGLRPDNRLLALNGISFSDSSSEEIIKFFNAVSNLGKGKPVRVDFAAQNTAGEWIIKRGRGVLGKFE